MNREFVSLWPGNLRGRLLQNHSGHPGPNTWGGFPPPHMGGILQDQFAAMGYYKPAFNAGYYGGQSVPLIQFNYGLTPPASLFHAGRAYNQFGSMGWDQQQLSSSGIGSHSFQPITSGFGQGHQDLE